jgi:hypothetical protein
MRPAKAMKIVIAIVRIPLRRQQPRRLDQHYSFLNFLQ